MMKICQIYEQKGVVLYLHERGLLGQYKKVKQYLLSGNTLQVKFKERNPKGSGIWCFRVNKQFRALCIFDTDGNLIVFKIDNHQ